MKAAINSLKIVLLLILAFCINPVQGQSKKTSIKTMIDSKHFIFKVQTIFPTGLISRQSTGEYDLRLAEDSLISYLPYFGRAYSAPPPDDQGYNFTSTEFQYSTKATKKGGWEILIRPNDIRDFREFSITISENGYGTLRALSNNRQPISYSGYITTLK